MTRFDMVKNTPTADGQRETFSFLFKNMERKALANQILLPIVPESVQINAFPCQQNVVWIFNKRLVS